jgi:hypothetical protein
MALYLREHKWEMGVYINNPKAGSFRYLGESWKLRLLGESWKLSLLGNAKAGSFRYLGKAGSLGYLGKAGSFRYLGEFSFSAFGENVLYLPPNRACGAVGSAPGSHPGGQGFESPQVHQQNFAKIQEIEILCSALFLRFFHERQLFPKDEKRKKLYNETI